MVRGAPIFLHKGFCLIFLKKEDNIFEKRKIC
jgi:hypothetical protein